MDDFLYAAFLFTLVAALTVGMWLVIGKPSLLRRALGVFVLVGTASSVTLLTYYDESASGCVNGLCATGIAFWTSLAGIAVCVVLAIVKRARTVRRGDGHSSPPK